METRQPPDVASAFEELGLPLDTPREKLRRAYLGVIKKRSPERDPEGFRRAREAFDLLTAWFQHAERFSLPMPSVPVPAVEAPPVPLPPPSPSVSGWAAVREHFLAQRDGEGLTVAAELFEGDSAPGEPEFTLHALLTIQTRSPGPAARRAIRAVVDWAQRTSSELAFLRVPQQWLLAQEFARLPPAIPPGVEAIFARFVLEGDVDGALARVAQFTREHGPEADAAILPLSDACPLFHRLFALALNPSVIAERDAREAAARAPAVVPEKSSGGSRAVGIWIGLMFLAVLGVLVQMGMTLAQATPAPPLAVPPTDPIEDVCKYAPPECARVREIVTLVSQNDCANARAAFEAFEGRDVHYGGSPAALAARTARELLRKQVRTCKSRSP